MYNFLLMLFSMLSFALNSIMSRYFQINIQKTPHSVNIFQALFTLIAAVIYIFCGIIKGEFFSPAALVPAALFGACFSAAILCGANCAELGYLSVSSVITNLSMLIPVIFSWAVMKEKIYLSSVFGIILIAITFMLSSAGAKRGGKGFRLWLLNISAAFFANGATAIIQKIQGLSGEKCGMLFFMGTAYGISSIIFLFVFILRNGKEKILFKNQITSPAALFFTSSAAGIGSCIGNGILSYLCTKINGGILYPFINGGLCVTVAIFSFAIFREKADKLKILSLITGIAAIILLNI